MTGNAVVLLASERRPLPAVTLTEVLATSDVPGGVVNVLTGYRAELVPVLAGHADVDALDTWGVPDDLRTDIELLAADDIKRLSRRPTKVAEVPLRLARRRRRRTPRMDRRLPRDEDGLAPDRRLRDGSRDRRRHAGQAHGRHVDPGAVERRVFVHATPREVWATLHDPGPDDRPVPRAPSRSGGAAVARGRDDTHRAAPGSACSATAPGSRASRRGPNSRFRVRVTGSGFDSEWSWRLEPVAGGTRVIHAATFEPFDRWTGILVRLGRASLASRVEAHLRALKERAEAARRSATPTT